MTDDTIDLDERRKSKKGKEQKPVVTRSAALYYCECGSGLMRLWTDGIVECVNCGGSLSGLWVQESE
jgi:hypothetical protein